MLKLIDGRGKIDACTGFTSGGPTSNDQGTLYKLGAIVQLKIIFRKLQFYPREQSLPEQFLHLSALNS
jgi:hypothetical protein